MSAQDVWGEDARTDRAIEHFHVFAAKTDADGRVVARHRYSRSFERVAHFLMGITWGSQSETVTIETCGGQTTVHISVVDRDGREWEQEGTAGREDGAYSWHALAACRALLNYVGDDGETMPPDAVVAMLEKQRADALAGRLREVG